MPRCSEVGLSKAPEDVGPGAAPVLLLRAGMAQRVQNSSVVLPKLCCAGLISVLVFLTRSSSLRGSVGQFCIKEKVRSTG